MLFAIAEVAAIVVSSYVRGLAHNAWCDNWGRGKYCLKCVKLTTWKWGSVLYKRVTWTFFFFFLFLHFFSTTRRLKYVEKFLRHLFKCSQCPSSLLLGILEKVEHWFIIIVTIILSAMLLPPSLSRYEPLQLFHLIRQWRSNTRLSINDYTPGHL